MTLKVIHVYKCVGLLGKVHTGLRMVDPDRMAEILLVETMFAITNGSNMFKHIFIKALDTY